MSFSLSNRALLRGMLAGAVVLTGTACSRSDRTESGRDTSAAALPDTSNVAQDTSSNVGQPSGGGTATGAMSDTAQSNTPRANTAPPRGKDTAGYRSMERDTTNIPGQGTDSARVTADTADASSSIAPSDSVSAGMSASSTDSAAIDASAAVSDTSSTEVAVAGTTGDSTEVSADTSAAGYAEMVRDTSTVADQADTAATDTATVVAAAGAADTTDNAGRIRPPEDSTEILGQVTTDSTAGAPSPDSTEVARVRPPEDSTEILGNVTVADEEGDETADEQVVRPEDRETVAVSETRTAEVGAAAVGDNVTGAEAAALMSREGVRCAIVDPEANEAVRWDMSNTPITLNPCGMGTMNLSRIWTEGQRESGTAGQ